MIRTIVVDNEWYSLIEICELVEKSGVMSVEGRFQNGADALREAEFIRPQAAFIDIAIPGMAGLTVAERLMENHPDIKIVFTTGWNQYAVSAFERNGLDYIMKPVNKTRFEKTAQHLQHEFSEPKSHGKAELAIRCFGNFETLENGNPIVWQCDKAKELFFLLVLNANAFVPKDVILENLWPNDAGTGFLPFLQISACKIRDLLSGCRESIHLNGEKGRYGLFLSEDVICDYQDLLNAVHGFRAGDRRTYRGIYSACRIFQNGLLSCSGYPWIGEYETKLWRSLDDCLQRIVDFLPYRKISAEFPAPRYSDSRKNERLYQCAAGR